MPVAYKDVSPESVIRIHEIIQMEKPANTQYYLRFASEGGGNDLSEFMAIGGGVVVGGGFVGGVVVGAGRVVGAVSWVTVWVWVACPPAVRLAVSV